MRFYRACDLPVRVGDRVFRESRWRAGLFAVIFAGIGVGGVVAVFLVGEWLARVVLGLIVGVWLLASLLIVSRFAHTLHRGNWRARCHAHSVLINLREFDNDGLDPAGEVILELKPGDVRSIRKLDHHSVVPTGKSGSQTARSVFLEIRLASRMDLAAIRERLELEAQRSPKWGRARNTFVGVRLYDDVLRVEWQSNWTHTVPRVDQLLASIKHTFPVGKVDETHSDLVTTEAGEESQEKQLLELTRAGHRLEAVKLARALYGCSLAEAQAHVEKLAAGGSVREQSDPLKQ